MLVEVREQILRIAHDWHRLLPGAPAAEPVLLLRSCPLWRDGLAPAPWPGRWLATLYTALLALGLSAAFRLFEQPPKSWSWWDYRNLAFRKNQGLRIDHILVSEPLKARVSACVIDKAPRKNERPSDHTPVVAQLSMD